MTLDLGPLRREDAIKLAGTFLDMSKQLALNCVQRAEGNPLFLEQLLRNVREHGDGDVPASIQSLVLARIDRPAARRQAGRTGAPQVHHARGHDLSATRPGCQKVIVAMIETL
jgi:hypothetical protein